MATSIDRPIRAEDGTTPVRVDGGGTGASGFICAYGTATLKNGDPPTGVFGKIMTEKPPGNHPHDAIPGEFLASGLGWRISRHNTGSADIPDALCGSGGVNNTLYVWTSYQNQDDDRDDRVFAGVCSTQTDCDTHLPSFQLEFLQTKAAQVPTKAPALMRVDAVGFTGDAVSVFNGNWKLQLTNGMHCVWDNGGDGKKTPLVELRLDIKQDNVWQLTFKLKRTTALYVQSNAHWVWSRANELLFTGGDAKKKGVPLTVRVSPV